MLPDIVTLLNGNRIVPVLTIEKAATAVPVARALARGGVTVVEVTLRTSEALEALRLIAQECPEMVAGAGTVLSEKQAEQSIRAGAQFLVTPGTTAALADAMATLHCPVLPGAATVSEMLALKERGFSALKFFPAEAAGGVDYLKSAYGPVPDLRFCPTGGIGPKNAADYLALPNVLCVGGSWLTPAKAVAEADAATIEDLARAASAAFAKRA